MNVNSLVLKLKDCVANLPEDEQSLALGIACGYVAGYSLPVFADSVGGTAEQVFIKEYQSQARKVLAQLNDITPIGLSDAMDVAKSTWCARYRMVHDVLSPEAMGVAMQMARSTFEAGTEQVVSQATPDAIVAAVMAFQKSLQEISE